MAVEVFHFNLRRVFILRSTKKYVHILKQFFLKGKETEKNAIEKGAQ